MNFIATCTAEAHWSIQAKAKHRELESNAVRIDDLMYTATSHVSLRLTRRCSPSRTDPYSPLLATQRPRAGWLLPSFLLRTFTSALTPGGSRRTIGLRSWTRFRFFQG